MSIPKFVMEDIEKVIQLLGDAIVHCGIFGSIQNKNVEEARDIDVLFVYSGKIFEEICEELKQVSLSYPHICSHRNYSSKIAKAPKMGKYYDFLFIPKKKPDRQFMSLLGDKVTYLTDPFDSWQKPIVVIESSVV
jgi:hypothetical protein